MSYGHYSARRRDLARTLHCMSDIRNETDIHHDDAPPRTRPDPRPASAGRREHMCAETGALCRAVGCDRAWSERCCKSHRSRPLHGSRFANQSAEVSRWAVERNPGDFGSPLRWRQGGSVRSAWWSNAAHTRCQPNGSHHPCRVCSPTAAARVVPAAAQIRAETPWRSIGTRSRGCRGTRGANAGHAGPLCDRDRGACDLAAHAGKSRRRIDAASARNAGARAGFGQPALPLGTSPMVVCSGVRSGST